MKKKTNLQRIVTGLNFVFNSLQKIKSYTRISVDDFLKEQDVPNYTVIGVMVRKICLEKNPANLLESRWKPGYVPPTNLVAFYDEMVRDYYNALKFKKDLKKQKVLKSKTSSAPVITKNSKQILEVEMCTAFLKKIHNLTKDQFVKFDLNEYIKQSGLAYGASLGVVIRDKFLVKGDKQAHYRWNNSIDLSSIDATESLREGLSIYLKKINQPDNVRSLISAKTRRNGGKNTPVIKHDQKSNDQPAHVSNVVSNIGTNVASNVTNPFEEELQYDFQTQLIGLYQKKVKKLQNDAIEAAKKHGITLTEKMLS